MLKRSVCGIALVFSLYAAGPAMAKDRPALAASSPWTLDYDADSCALRRRFGDGREAANLELRRFSPGQDLQATISSSRMRVRRPVMFKYRFGSDGRWNDAGGAYAVTMVDGSSGVLFSPSLIDLPELDALDREERAAYFKTLDMREVEREASAKADSIALRGAFGRELALRLGSLEAPIAALNECIDELMTHWNIDVEAHKTLTRPARPVDFPESASMVGYPPKMVRQGMPGLVNIRLAIDQTGRITSCRIQMPLSDPEFEASSCADIQHAFEFEPALDKDGKPIASYWVTKVLFQIDAPFLRSN